MSFKGNKSATPVAHTVKSKGMPGVTADKTANNGARQMSQDLDEKFVTKRRHA